MEGQRMTSEETHVAKAVEETIRVHGPNAPLTIARAAIRAVDIYRMQTASTDDRPSHGFRFPPVERNGTVERDDGERV
jgi:hypothetical protein